MISDSKRWLVVLVVIVALSGFSMTVWTAGETDKIMHEQLLIKTRLAAAGVNSSQISALAGDTTDLNSPAYISLKEQMAALHKSDPDISFAYLIGQNPDGTYFFFVDSEPYGSVDYSPPGQPYPEASELLASVYTTGTGLTEGPEADRWGTWISGIVPIKDPDGSGSVAVFGMDADAEDWQKEIFLATLPPITVTLLVIALISGFFLIHQQNLQARKKIEEAGRNLFENEEKFRAVFENANDPILLLELSKQRTPEKILAANSMACRRLKYTSEEFSGMSVSEINDHENFDKIQENVEKLIETGNVTFEGVYVAKDGEKIPVEISANLITLRGREVVINHIRDITKRKNAEMRLKKTEKEYRSLIENSSDIIAVLDLNGDFLFTSPSFYSTLGYQNSSSGISCMLDLIHPDDVQKACDKINLGIEKTGTIHSVEVRVRQADSQWRIFEVVGKVSSWGEHERAIIINARDITKRKEDEEQIRLLNRQLVSETEALGMAQEGLNILNEQLEDKVLKRTSELEQVNAVLTEKNLTFQIMNICSRALLKTNDESEFMKQICSGLVSTGWYPHTWIAGINAETTTGFFSASEDDEAGISGIPFARYLPPCAEEVMKTGGGLKVMVSPDDICAGCPFSDSSTERFTIIVRLNADDKTVGILGVTLRDGIAPRIHETDRIEHIAHEIAFAVLYLRTKQLEQAACGQISKNLEQLATLNDHIRNPLQGIIGYADLGEGEVFENIIGLSMEINSIVTRLDRGYLESKKIRNFIELHEHATERPGNGNDKPADDLDDADKTNRK